MKFERFYLVDSRGAHGRVLLKFYHISSGKPIDGSTVDALRILQSCEIQVQTRFATDSFAKRFAGRKHRNLRHVQSGDPINVYAIPVKLSEDGRSFMAQFE